MFLWGLSELGGRREMKELKYANEPIHLPLVLNQFPKDGIRDQRAGKFSISLLPSPIFLARPWRGGEIERDENMKRESDGKRSIEKIQTKQPDSENNNHQHSATANATPTAP